MLNSTKTDLNAKEKLYFNLTLIIIWKGDSLTIKNDILAVGKSNI